MSCQLLLVDDEPNVSRSIRRALRSCGYEIHIAADGKQALDLLEKQPINVILSDHRMPGMTGAELLAIVRERYPSIVNIMLSGQADMTAVIDAVNEGNIYKFLQKPWSNETLREVVAEAAELATNRSQANDSGILSEEQFFELTSPNNPIDNTALVLLELRNANELRSHPENAIFLNELITQLSRFGSEYLGETVVPLQVLEGNLFAAILYDFDALSAENFFYALSNKFSFTSNAYPVVALGYASVTADIKASFNNALSALTSAPDGQAAKYSQSVGEKLRLGQSLKSDMFSALEAQQFYLQYQPQISCKNEQMLGVESLCRWQHPGEGCVSPETFIDLAEQTGFINQLGLWVIKQACQALYELQSAGMTNVRLSVNVSPKQFGQREWVDAVIDFVGKQTFSSKYLELEITESSVMTNGSHALETIAELRSCGIRIAMDDFGTGHSSLGQINQLPIDVLKLDRSLIMNIEHSSKSEALLRNILSLAKDLGLETIAEGVETAAQAEICRQYGCDLIQGYYYHKPMHFSELMALSKDY